MSVSDGPLAQRFSLARLGTGLDFKPGHRSGNQCPIRLLTAMNLEHLLSG